MIKYTEIKFEKYVDLYDKSGYYCTVSSHCTIYRKDNKWHNEYGAAIVYHESQYKTYYLESDCYGSNNPRESIHYIPSDEYWIKYQKLMVFS